MHFEGVVSTSFMFKLTTYLLITNYFLFISSYSCSLTRLIAGYAFREHRGGWSEQSYTVDSENKEISPPKTVAVKSPAPASILKQAARTTSLTEQLAEMVKDSMNLKSPPASRKKAATSKKKACSEDDTELYISALYDGSVQEGQHVPQR